jgi:hypothetical protein
MVTGSSSQSGADSSLLVIRNFISSDEARSLNDFVDAGTTNGFLDKGITGVDVVEDGVSVRVFDRGYTKRLTTRMYGDRFEYPDLVYQIFSRITDRLSLGDLDKSVNGRGRNGVVVSNTLPGGDVYVHTDPMEELGRHVLRCNIMTRAADAGGLLQVGGVPVNIGVGDLHCYLASHVRHSVTTVEGQTSRVLWMFGYQIYQADWEDRVKKLAAEYSS